VKGDAHRGVFGREKEGQREQRRSEHCSVDATSGRVRDPERAACGTAPERTSATSSRFEKATQTWFPVWPWLLRSLR
jgi:hypothetical protein